MCVGETDAAVVQGRASVVSRTSLSCATRTCGKRSSSASVLVRSFSVRLFTKPRASSAMMNGWITMFPWLRCLRNSLFPERRWSIQIDVSARINSAAPCGVEYSSIAALCLPGTPICERFLLGDAYEIVIKCNGCSHRKLQALVIALNDVILCACICRVTNATDLASVAAGRKNSFAKWRLVFTIALSLWALMLTLNYWKWGKQTKQTDAPRGFASFFLAGPYS